MQGLHRSNRTRSRDATSLWQCFIPIVISANSTVEPGRACEVGVLGLARSQ